MLEFCQNWIFGQKFDFSNSVHKVVKYLTFKLFFSGFVLDNMDPRTEKNLPNNIDHHCHFFVLDCYFSHLGLHSKKKVRKIRKLDTDYALIQISQSNSKESWITDRKLYSGFFDSVYLYRNFGVQVSETQTCHGFFYGFENVSEFLLKKEGWTNFLMHTLSWSICLFVHFLYPFLWAVLFCTIMEKCWKDQ